MAIEHADFEGIERLAAVLGAEIVSTFDQPEGVRIGTCDLIEEIMIGEDKVMRFSGVSQGQACSLVLRGATEQVCFLNQNFGHQMFHRNWNHRNQPIYLTESIRSSTRPSAPSMTFCACCTRPSRRRASCTAVGAPRRWWRKRCNNWWRRPAARSNMPSNPLPMHSDNCQLLWLTMPDLVSLMFPKYDNYFDK